jgi:hypothetical protein
MNSKLEHAFILLTVQEKFSRKVEENKMDLLSLHFNDVCNHINDKTKVVRNSERINA